MTCTRNISSTNWPNVSSTSILQDWSIGMSNPPIFSSIPTAKLGSVILDYPDRCGSTIIRRLNLQSSLPLDGTVHLKFYSEVSSITPSPTCGVLDASFINSMPGDHCCLVMTLLSRYKRCSNLKVSPTRNKRNRLEFLKLTKF